MRTRNIPMLAALVLNAALFAGTATFFTMANQNVVPISPLPEIFAFAQDRLPERDALTIKEAYRSSEPHIVARQAELMRSMANVVTAVGSPHYNPEAARAVFDDFRRKKAQLDELLLETLLGALAQFSPEGRQILVSPYKLNGP